MIGIGRMYPSTQASLGLTVCIRFSGFAIFDRPLTGQESEQILCRIPGSTIQSYKQSNEQGESPIDDAKPKNG